MYQTRPRGTNPYFNNFNSSMEAQLWEDLIIESIKQFGQDMFYLPKILGGYDEIYGEDDQEKYTTAYPIELYIKSVDGFTGDGVFLSNFGLQIQDQVTFTLAKRIFEQEVGRPANIPRPNEGDLIYFPLNKKLFQIQYVDYKPFFYQFGALQTYDITCSLFEYSGQELSTGIEEIDELQSKYSFNALDFSVITQNGKIILSQEDDYIVREEFKSNPFQDPIGDNDEIQNETETEQLFSWNETDPFSSSGKY